MVRIIQSFKLSNLPFLGATVPTKINDLIWMLLFFGISIELAALISRGQLKESMLWMVSNTSNHINYLQVECGFSKQEKKDKEIGCIDQAYAQLKLHTKKRYAFNNFMSYEINNKQYLNRKTQVSRIRVGVVCLSSRSCRCNSEATASDVG